MDALDNGSGGNPPGWLTTTLAGLGAGAQAAGAIMATVNGTTAQPQNPNAQGTPTGAPANSTVAPGQPVVASGNNKMLWIVGGGVALVALLFGGFMLFRKK